MLEDTREDIEVGTREGLEAVQVAKNCSENVLTMERRKGENMFQRIYQHNNCEC